jgi:hypothetical protein
MPITLHQSGGFTCTGDGISLYRMLALRSALSLEMKGLRARRGFSAYAAIKREFGLKGNKAKVLEAFTVICDQASAKVTRVETAPTFHWRIGGQDYKTPIQPGACPFCKVAGSVVALPPPLLAQQTDGTTHVCHPDLKGCDQGFENTAEAS